ncbi:MAG TPA: hypothetical protein VIV83_09685 [Gemmatimonadales bacterium]|jgi:hypothetical protein
MAHTSMRVPVGRTTRVRVTVAAETAERHREKTDGPYGKGESIKIHLGA